MTQIDPLDNPLDAITHPRTEAESLLEAAQAAHREVKRGKWLNWPVPGYNNVLYLRFEKMEAEDVEELGNRFRQSTSLDDRLSIAADEIIERCRRVCMRNAAGKFIAIPGLNAEETLGRGLATALNLDGGASMSPRECLFAMLGPRGETAIIGAMRAVMDWSSGVSDDTHESVAGE